MGKLKKILDESFGKLPYVIYRKIQQLESDINGGHYRYLPLSIPEISDAEVEKLIQFINTDIDEISGYQTIFNPGDLVIDKFTNVKGVIKDINPNSSLYRIIMEDNPTKLSHNSADNLEFISTMDELSPTNLSLKLIKIYVTNFFNITILENNEIQYGLEKYDYVGNFEVVTEKMILYKCIGILENVNGIPIHLYKIFEDFLTNTLIYSCFDNINQSISQLILVNKVILHNANAMEIVYGGNININDLYSKCTTIISESVGEHIESNLVNNYGNSITILLNFN